MSAKPWKAYGLGIGLLLAALAGIYLPAHNYPFLVDDTHHFINNQSVRSWSGLRTAWITDYWENTGNAGLYRPLLKALWTIQIAGLGGAKWIILTVSLITHALNALLVALICLRAGIPRLFAMLAASWFALHTAHVEVLMTGVGQGELFTLFLSLCALSIVFPNKESHSVSHPRLRLALFVLLNSLNFFVKEQAMAAAMAGICILWMNGAFRPKEKILATALTLFTLCVWVLVRFQVIGTFGPQGIYQAGSYMYSWERAIFVIETLGRYALLALAPMRLYLEYTWLDQSFPPRPVTLQFWTGVVTILIVLALAWRGLRKRDWPLLAALAMTFIPLSLFLNLRPIGTLFAERHAYHALAGFAVLIALGASRLIQISPTPLRTRKMANVAIAIWALLMGQRAAFEVRLWKDGLTLWETMFERQPKSFFAAENVSYYSFYGFNFPKAREYGELALKIRPGAPQVSMTLGELDILERKFDSARAHFLEAAFHPGFVLRSRVALARIDVHTGNLQKARETYAWFMQNHPNIYGLTALKNAILWAEQRQQQTQSPN